MGIEIFKKSPSEKLSLVTCYDYSFAELLSHSEVDAVLVGDSLAMTMHGHSTTLQADLELMKIHTAAVARGLNGLKFLISDLPFLSYRSDLPTSIRTVTTLMQAGAQAVKLEGCDGNLDLIKHLVDSGVPVMGHVGLTPQFVNQFGGFKVQGRQKEAAEKILSDALGLEKAGVFSVVIECVPSALGKQISQELKIPTIGIGAGPDTDGQILVLQDLLGMSPKCPKFVRPYLDGRALFVNSLNEYSQSVKSGQFPSESESYS